MTSLIRRRARSSATNDEGPPSAPPYINETVTSRDAGGEPKFESTAFDLEPAVDEEHFPTIDPASSNELTPSSRTARLLVFSFIPLLALIVGAGAGYLKWHQGSLRAAQNTAAESVRIATDGTIKMLSYSPDSVEHDLGAAADLLSGSFRDAYTALTNDVVIPGSKQQQIAAVATVPAASSVSATADHAVVLVFVNQTIIVGSEAPSSTTSSVRVTLDRENGRWLITGFDPT